MPEFLNGSEFWKGLGVIPSAADPWLILARLLLALALGSVVAWIYRGTSRSGGSALSLPTTLVLLAVLIAMVTQVIGDNVARAFSLVGALSIVRFRTVVRDTRDTAFVIFAVVVGMAVGSQHPWVAVLGILVGGAAAYAMADRSEVAQSYVLRVRVTLGKSCDSLLDEHAPLTRDRRLLAVSTARQGAAYESTYELRLPTGSAAEDLVRTLNELEGVQEVRVQHRDFEQE